MTGHTRERAVRAARDGDEPGTGIVGWIGHTPRRAFLAVFVLAWAVRGSILALGILPPDLLKPQGEIGRVAVSLAASGAYADPYLIPTGPTAHPAPFYTAVLALIYALFGVTGTASLVRALLGITGYATLYATLPWLAARLGVGLRAGIIAGLAGAVLPPQGLQEVTGAWNDPYPALALGLVVTAFLRRWGARLPSAVASCVLGVACGFAFHLSPPILTVVVGLVAFELWWRRTRRRWRHAVLICLGALVALLPWTIRNYAAFGEVMFVRSNFGLELRLANHDGAKVNLNLAASREPGFRHPSQNVDEARQVRNLGESEYMRRARAEALDWIRSHPAAFARLTVLRVAHFWFGPLDDPMTAGYLSLITLLTAAGLRRVWPNLNRPERAAIAIPLALFPIVFYTVSYLPEYRSPLHWLLLVLAGAEIGAWGAGMKLPAG
jgi:hypothetical protein